MLQSEKTNRTHRELLRAARSLFLERGYDRTSIAEIVAEAGYSTGVFYRHFKTKPDILKELWSEFLEEFIAGSIRGAMDAPSLEAAIDFLIQRSAAYFSHPMFACYYGASVISGLPGSREFTPTGAKDFTAMLYQLLRRENPNGEEGRLRTYASAIHAVINAYSASEVLNQDYYFDEAATREILLSLTAQAGGRGKACVKK